MALATRWFADWSSPAVLLDLGRQRDLREFFLSAPVRRPAEWRSELRAGGVTICGVGADVSASAAESGPRLVEAVDCASTLRASAVVVEGGELPDAAQREEQAERAVRALFPLLARGTPLAIRNGGGPDDLLGFVETEWLLSDLRGLKLWLDPARALKLHRHEAAPPPEAWADAYAGRVGGVFVHGLGSGGLGGSHPADDGPDWGGLSALLPQRVPWVLDLSPELSSGEVTDARHHMDAVRGTTR